METKNGKCHTKTHTPSSWIRTTDAEVGGTATYLFTYSGSYMTIYQIDMYLYVQIDVWERKIKKRKQYPPQGDDKSTV